MSCREIPPGCPGTASPTFPQDCLSEQDLGARRGSSICPPYLHLSAVFFIHLHITTELNLSRCASSMKLQFLLLTAAIISPLLPFENRKRHAAKIDHFDECLHAFSALSLPRVIENYRTSPQHVKC